MNPRPILGKNIFIQIQKDLFKNILNPEICTIITSGEENDEIIVFNISESHILRLQLYTSQIANHSYNTKMIFRNISVATIDNKEEYFNVPGLNTYFNQAIIHANNNSPSSNNIITPFSSNVYGDEINNLNVNDMTDVLSRLSIFNKSTLGVSKLYKLTFTIEQQ